MPYNNAMCPDIFTYVSLSAAQTQAAGEALAAFLEPGDVVLMDGDLGAGKTCFTQGVAGGLRIGATVTSPTFNIVVAYEGGTLPLYHFDLYRLEDESQLDDVGYWEYLEGDGASFVEWALKFPQTLPLDYLHLEFSADLQGVRTIRATANGARARQLLGQWSNSIHAE